MAKEQPTEVRRRIALTSEPIELEALLAELEEPTSGAVAVFIGRVRNQHEGREVRSIHYQAYAEMAEPVMRSIADELCGKFPVRALAMVHRFGHLQVGEASVVVAVATGHRGAAFDACRFGIDRIKEDVPIWKKEVLADGSEEWVDARTKPARGPLENRSP